MSQIFTPLFTNLFIANLIAIACIVYILIKRAQKRKHDSHKTK
ncbi:hypothetical protein [Polynucleobacter sp. JS-Safj-400b-B2]|nr:hypothetical protein [Polynucleobacter sp. JS-Safj-400b-B2]